MTWRAAGGRKGYQTLREIFGGVLLLGLEILVAADLIRTVAVSPALRNVAVLGLIVLIRTFLSLSLQVEIQRELPWRPGLTSGVTARKGPGDPTYPGRARLTHRAGSRSSMRFRPQRATW